MKDEFEEFIDLIERNLDRCPWIKKKTVEDYKKEILNEAQEVMQAQNNENLQEELGDLFWDVVVLAYLAEKEGRFKASEIIKTVKEKMKRRKPFLLGEKKELDLEECKKIWYEEKEKEKK